VRDYLPGILKRQLTEPIDFKLQLDIASMDCVHFIEVGPRAFLVPLIKENLFNKKVKVSWAMDLLQPRTKKLQPLSKIKRSQVGDSTLTRVNSVIARITGYSIEQIRFEDKFQEDLGIDSIKTLEISLEVQRELKLPPSTLRPSYPMRTVGELAFQVETQTKNPSFGSEERKESPSPFHLYQRVWREKENSQEFPSEPPENVEWLKLEDPSDIVSIHHSVPETGRKLVLDCSAISDSFTTADFIINTIPEFFIRVQELIKSERINHQTDVRVLGLKEKNGFSTMVTTFLRSLKKENEIAFVSEILFEKRSEIRKEIVIREFGTNEDQNVTFKNGRRYVLEYEPNQIVSEKIVPEKGNLVVIGGSRGIAKSAVSQIFEPEKWNVHVLGRTPTEKVDESSYYQADATDEGATAKAFKCIVDNYGPIDLMVHAAGSELSRKFREKTQDEIKREWISKAYSSQIASDLASKYSIPTAILFSSVISEFGNQGQAVYGAANAFARRIWEGDGAGLSGRTVIDWPPWQNTGMTANPVINDILERAGVALLQREEGARWFREGLAIGGGILCSENDLLLYKGPLIHLRALNNLQTVVFPHQGMLSIEFQVSLQEFPELLDHSVGGSVLLPLALMATWFLQIAGALTGREVDLSELQIFRPLEITENQLPLLIRVKKSSSDKNGFELNLINSEKTVSHGRVQSRFPVASHTTTNNPDIQKQFQAEEIYVLDGLFHGLKFKLLARVDFQRNEKVVGIPHFTRVKQLNQEKFPRVFAMIETALQTAAVAGWKLQNWRGLPVAIEGVLLKEELIKDNDWFWEIFKIRIGQENMTASLRLLNGEGQFIGKIEKVVFQKKA
jgi:acyl carrier protein